MLRIVLLLIGAALATGCATNRDVTLVVENARVIVGDNSVLERANVAIAGERIVSVGTAPVHAPAARRIEAAGRTVLPGLIDTHTHLLMENLFAQPRSDAEIEEFMAERLPDRLRAFTAAGITTVISVGEFWPSMAEVSADVRSGELAGPRVYTSGPLFTAPDGHPASTFCGSMDRGGPNPWCRAQLTREVDTRQAVQTAVSALSKQGVDLIKFVYDASDGPEVNVLRAELVGELIDAAHEHDLRAYAHSLEASKAVTVIERGVDALVHLPAIFSSEVDADSVAQHMRMHDVSASTTLTTFDSAAGIVAELGDEETSGMLRGLLSGMRESLGAVAEVAPHLIALGTDAPHLPPAEAYHREIRLLSEAGLTREQILHAATKGAADYMGLGRELGTLEPGKFADLIIVEGNPLDELSALTGIVLVIKGGEIIAPSP